MHIQRITYLINGLEAGKLTEEEKDELLQAISGPEQDAFASELANRFDARWQNPEPLNAPDEEIFSRIIHTDKKETGELAESLPLHQPPVQRLKAGGWWRAVAAMLFLVITITIIWKKPWEKPEADHLAKTPEFISPGMEGAILTLADGTQIVLDSMGNGIVASQGGVNVTLEDGELKYNGTGADENGVPFHTMTTPKGRQFMVMLPDGSKVWLNAASSLYYPVVFAGNERRVRVAGEAYFEIAKLPMKPFIVDIAGKAEVKVLGTHFNINAYENEAEIKTTLLEGLVQMKSAGSASPGADLKPGQQGRLPLEKWQGQVTVTNAVNLAQVMAWKNGVFDFEGMRLSEVLKQLERWYDVEVVMEKNMEDIEFYGELKRSNSLNDIIAAFRDADVVFEIEGRKLIVRKN